MVVCRSRAQKKNQKPPILTQSAGRSHSERHQNGSVTRSGLGRGPVVLPPGGWLEAAVGTCSCYCLGEDLQQGNSPPAEASLTLQLVVEARGLVSGLTGIRLQRNFLLLNRF